LIKAPLAGHREAIQPPTRVSLVTFADCSLRPPKLNYGVIKWAGSASGIKGENPVNSVIGAGIGSVAGSKSDKYITGGLSTAAKEGTAEVIGAIGGSAASEIVGGITKDTLDKVEQKNEEK